MEDKIVIVVVVCVAVAAHIWLFNWIKFKMDEGAISKYLHDTSKDKYRSSEEISLGTHMALKRVSAVCGKSKSISRDVKEGKSWCLN